MKKFWFGSIIIFLSFLIASIVYFFIVNNVSLYTVLQDNKINKSFSIKEPLFLEKEEKSEQEEITPGSIHNASDDHKESKNEKIIPKTPKIFYIEENKQNISTVHIPTSSKKLGYIKKIYIDPLGHKKIDIDYIEVLPNEECLPALICFKNTVRKSTSHIVSENITIHISTLDYFQKENQNTYISFKDFWTMFNPDYPEETHDYNQFKEIPYRITQKNNRITSIEEQPISSLYIQ